jgi:SAM-dependent methyltransferase
MSELSPAVDRRTSCPVCDGNLREAHRLDGWGHLLRCAACGLGVASPLVLPAPPRELFDQAYRGRRPEAGMTMFAHRLRWREDISRAGKPWLGLAPVHRHAILEIRRRLSPGALVFDVGCGPGLFLEELKRLGYRTAGIEPSAAAAAVAQRLGHDVAVSSLEELESAPPDVAIVVSFFVLHHTPDPLGFARRLRTLFPTTLLLSEHDFDDPGFRPGSLDRPPRRLTWWTGDALTRLLQRAGYTHVEVVPLPALPYVHQIEGLAAALYGAISRWLPLRMRAGIVTGYLVAKNAAMPVLSRVPGLHSGARHHLLAIAEP